MSRKISFALAMIGVGFLICYVGSAYASGSVTCKTVNLTYPHGVGKVGAKDHTKSGTGGVTNFKRSNRLYNLYKSSDRDHDGVACERK